MSIIEGGHSIVDLFSGVNNELNGMLFAGLLFVIFVVYLIIFHKEDMKSVFLADSFVTFVIGSLFFAIGWINFSVLIIPIIFIFIGIFMKLFME